MYASYHGYCSNDNEDGFWDPVTQDLQTSRNLHGKHPHLHNFVLKCKTFHSYV